MEFAIAGAIVNWGLFVVIFAVVSLNRDVFSRDFRTLAMISLICVITAFGLWPLTNFVLRKLKFKDEIRKSLVLAATIKNSGFAAATAPGIVWRKGVSPRCYFKRCPDNFLVLIGLKPKEKLEKKPGKNL